MAYRKFNGKRYYESMIRYNKPDAEKAAKSIRNRGGMARITRVRNNVGSGYMYTIWERG